MTPREFIAYRDKLRRQIATLEEDIEKAYELALRYPPPAKLRRAKPADIVVGQVIWYVYERESNWCVVEEVLDPQSEWDAYKWNGSNRGLHSAFVEVVEPDGKKE